MFRKKKTAAARTVMNRFARETLECAQLGVMAPIPRLFQRTFGGYFRECVLCRRPLRSDCADTDPFEDGAVELGPYLVVKTVRRGEPWVEYAICVECLEKLQGSLSRDSNARVEELFDYGVRVRDRFDKLVGSKAPVDAWVDGCILSGESRAKAADYQLLALCVDTNILFNSMPYAVCGRGYRIVDDCHSAQSKKKISKFVKRCLGVEAALYDRYPR